MTGRPDNVRRRVLTWCGLAAVPVLAIAAAGPGLSTAVRADAPGGMLMGETWEFNAQGNRLTDPTGLTGTEVQGVWQNTVRPPFVPSPRGPYVPPTPPPFGP
jgi:hypothetical protein